MLSEVMDYFGFDKELDHLGFFETDEHTHLEKELQRIIRQGRLEHRFSNRKPGLTGC